MPRRHRLALLAALLRSRSDGYASGRCAPRASQDTLRDRLATVGDGSTRSGPVPRTGSLRPAGLRSVLY